MKWDKLFLIKLAADKTIDESAEVYREWEKVPDNQLWADPRCAGWQELVKGCFKQSRIPTPTIKDKLMIIAHGSPTHVGVESSSATETLGGDGYDAKELARFLAQWGVTAIGLVTFKACYIGKGRFLEDFVLALPKFKLEVGWVKGYKGPAATINRTAWDVPFLGGTTGKPYESITREEPGLLSYIGAPAYGDDRFKIVRGNAAHKVSVKGPSRYTIDAFQEVGDS
jgi:hypothetical protein